MRGPKMAGSPRKDRGYIPGTRGRSLQLLQKGRPQLQAKLPAMFMADLSPGCSSSVQHTAVKYIISTKSQFSALVSTKRKCLRSKLGEQSLKRLKRWASLGRLSTQSQPNGTNNWLAACSAPWVEVMEIPLDHGRDSKLQSWHLIVMKVFTVTKEDIYLRDIH